MIEIQDKVFHLKTEHYSYLLRINDWGQPEHLHFGAPVQTQDYSGFLCRPGLGWGASVLLDDSSTASSPDDKALEWSGSGRGDYRESPLEIGASTDLRFAGACVGKPAPMACGLPMAHGGQEELELTLRQEGLELTLIYTPYETALTRRAVLKNTGTAPVTLNKLMSFQLDIPGSFHMASFHGGIPPSPTHGWYWRAAPALPPTAAIPASCSTKRMPRRPEDGSTASIWSIPATITPPPSGPFRA